MRSQRDIIDSLPTHLRGYVDVQDYARYTARDQAGWRYLMRNLTRRLKHSAHPVYMEGLRRTGISLDYIPKIEEMNAALAELGWSALVVNGFIPPAVFMEFQARRVLVIAADMRRTEHLLYTPAPDIVHEAAGHAPFLVDVDYAEFLERFGELGMRALHTAEDMAVYRAIRDLSVIKEKQGSTGSEIEAANARLSAALAAVTEPSEAALLSRLHWWTVEYGLVGTPDDYALFGAGLLSSLGESSRCLDDAAVPKLPLTVDAIETPYDITSPQPQLFVTRSCRHLTQVLEEFARGMAYSRGGADSVQKAIDCRSIATLQYDTGMQVSGEPATLLRNAVGNEIYIGTTGPTQLAYAGKQLHAHGIEAHPDGFGSPVGAVKDVTRCLSTYSVDELQQLGIGIDQRVTLEFVSGVTVSGELRRIYRKDHKNLLLTFADCRVLGPDGAVLFEPAWGRYDMAVGSRISSVFGGRADPEPFAGQAAALSRVPIDPLEPDLAGLYERVAAIDAGAVPDVAAIVEAAQTTCPDEWLLLSDLRARLSANHAQCARIETLMRDIARRLPVLAESIELDLAC